MILAAQAELWRAGQRDFTRIRHWSWEHLVADGSLIELATLPARHPKIGDILLRFYGAQLVVRLSLDPQPQPAGTRQREVKVNRIASTAREVRRTEVREIGWHGFPEISEDFCIRARYTSNEQDITEAAAITLMGLLIHELEGGILERVAPIGSGGDYFVKLSKSKQTVQVEVSGIREDLVGSEVESRLRKKRAQLLTKSDSGYVSVTTFHHAANGGPYSFLHFVETDHPKGKKRRKPNTKRKGK